MRISVLLSVLVIGGLLTTQCQAQVSTRDKLVVESLLRLDDVQITGNEKLEAAVQRYLKAVKGTPKFFAVIEKLNFKGASPELLQMAIKSPLDSSSVKAAELLLDFDNEQLLIDKLSDEDTAVVNACIQSLSRTTHAKTLDILKPLVPDVKLSRQVRSAAISGVGKNLVGQKHLLELLKKELIPKELLFTTGTALFASPDKSIREAATQYIMPPEAAGKTPLAPVSVLVAKAGDQKLGKTLFDNKATCAKCHKVKGEGKEVGPDLSEVGSKLSKAAMYVAILDPSAGISHNYETYSVVTVNGNILTGVLVSQSDDAVVIKSAEAVTTTVSSEDIDELINTGVSLMPADLQKVLSEDDLVNLVEYLTTLVKP